MGNDPVSFCRHHTAIVMYRHSAGCLVCAAESKLAAERLRREKVSDELKRVLRSVEELELENSKLQVDLKLLRENQAEEDNESGGGE